MVFQTILVLVRMNTKGTHNILERQKHICSVTPFSNFGTNLSTSAADLVEIWHHVESKTQSICSLVSELPPGPQGKKTTHIQKLDENSCGNKKNRILFQPKAGLRMTQIHQPIIPSNYTQKRLLKPQCFTILLTSFANAGRWLSPSVDLKSPSLAKSSVSIHLPSTPDSLERAPTSFPSVLPRHPRNPWHLHSRWKARYVGYLLGFWVTHLTITTWL